MIKSPPIVTHPDFTGAGFSIPCIPELPTDEWYNAPIGTIRFIKGVMRNALLPIYEMCPQTYCHTCDAARAAEYDLARPHYMIKINKATIAFFYAHLYRHHKEDNSC